MRLLFVALLLAGCASKELGDVQIKKMIIDYFTPYTSTTIAKPLDVNVLAKKKLSSDKIVAKVCYSFKFLTSYDRLVAKIKKDPNSFLARFDIGLVALYGRKFGNFHEGEVKTRCDTVEFERRYGKWMIKRI